MTGNFAPYGFPVAGLVDAGPVEPLHPPMTFEQITKYRSVSSALPGPMTASHQPGFLIALVIPGNMGIAGEGMADQDGVALLAVEPAVRLIRKGKRRKRLPTFKGEGGGMMVRQGFYHSRGSFDHRQAPS